MKTKLMIACLRSDPYSIGLVQAMAEKYAERAGQKYRWRDEAACSIGRIETDKPNQFPVFVIGESLTNLASLGSRENCGQQGRILIVSRASDVVASYGFPDPGEFAETYLSVPEPVLGFQRIILPTSNAQFRAFASMSALSIVGKLDGADGNESPEVGFSALFAMFDPQTLPRGEETPARAVAAT
jgi:hypothetical protein